ncbi:hypothetical protein WK61_02165 [Burkholderia ubonensis]|nr:hypothetical protein WK61_02165 [Burkholderia ubonensis]
MLEGERVRRRVGNGRSAIIAPRGAACSDLRHAARQCSHEGSSTMTTCVGAPRRRETRAGIRRRRIERARSRRRRRPGVAVSARIAAARITPGEPATLRRPHPSAARRA